MLEAGPGVQEAEELAEYPVPLPTFHHFSPASASPKLFSQNKETEAVVAEKNIAVNSRKNVPVAPVTENVINASDNSSRLNLNGSGSAAAAASTPPSSSSTITYIPGDYNTELRRDERGHSYVSWLGNIKTSESPHAAGKHCK